MTAWIAGGKLALDALDVRPLVDVKCFIAVEPQRDVTHPDQPIWDRTETDTIVTVNF